ncbi:unnamed protein product [Lota lota]
MRQLMQTQPSFITVSFPGLLHNIEAQHISCHMRWPSSGASADHLTFIRTCIVNPVCLSGVEWGQRLCVHQAGATLGTDCGRDRDTVRLRSVLDNPGAGPAVHPDKQRASDQGVKSCSADNESSGERDDRVAIALSLPPPSSSPADSRPPTAGSGAPAGPRRAARRKPQSLVQSHARGRAAATRGARTRRAARARRARSAASGRRKRPASSVRRTRERPKRNRRKGGALERGATH